MLPGARAVAATALLVLAGCADGERADLLIRGGTVVDGSGAAGRRVDIVVRDGHIVALDDGARLPRWEARRTLDATGLVVAPGFVDLHSHADLVLLADDATRTRLLAAKLRQGVTTTIVGNCGLGVAPADGPAAAILADVNGWMTPEGVVAGPLDVAGYLARLETAGLPLNVGTLVPHGPVRIATMGLGVGAPTAAQLQAMQTIVGRGLDDGAFGLSVGLIYPPGMFSPTAELTALARVVAEHDGLFTAHIRGSSETLLAATDELIAIGRESGARVHHSHMEAVGERFWPGVPEMLAREDAARAAGLDISHDVFPYTRAATMMAAIFPPWSLEGGVPKLLERLADPATRARIRHDVETRIPQWPPWREGGWPHNLVEAVGWDGIIVASVGSGSTGAPVGRDLATIGEERDRPPFDVVADLMLEHGGRVGQLVDEISGKGTRLDALRQIFAHPAAAVISDAEDYGRGAPHPAHAGAFARALRLARDEGWLSLEETLYRMTGWPAARIGLEDRGVLRPGAVADVVIFDPTTVADRADWDHPREPAVGFRWVVVNGTVVVDDGRLSAGSHGVVLRSR